MAGTIWMSPQEVEEFLSVVQRRRKPEKERGRSLFLVAKAVFSGAESPKVGNGGPGPHRTEAERNAGRPSPSGPVP